MPTLTSNYGLQKPIVNSATDQDLWGGQLNTDMDEIDNLMSSAINWIPSSKTANFSVTAPTSSSGTIGDSKVIFLCDATGGAITASLPAAASCSGMTVAFKKTDASANAVTVQGNGAETIDGSNTYVISAQYVSIIIASNGANWFIVAEVPSLPTNLIKTVKVQKYIANGTHTPSPGMLFSLVEVQGAGGGSGSTNGGGSAGGGGAGGYDFAIFNAAQIGASQVVTIGTAGAGGSAGSSGATGGTTSLGTLISATGGTGGGQIASAGAIAGVGGVGSISGFHGEPGGWGLNIGGTGCGGNGGSSRFGGGGRGSVTPGNGENATGYGAGGGGPVATVGSVGGNGSPGIMIITEYCSQ